MAVYQAPEGYRYDENTGLYFNQIRANDENGNPVRIVTWFNADTGEYTREFYPEGVSTDDSRGKQEIKEKKKTGKVVLLAVALLALAALIFFGVRFFKDRNPDSGESAGTSYDSDESEPVSSSTAEPDYAEDDSEQAMDIEYHNPGGDLTTVWDWNEDYNYAGYHNSAVCADDTYIYALCPYNSNFSFGPGIIGIDEEDGDGGMPYGRIIRFPKSGDGNVETIVDPPEYVYSFALMGDYIYYSTGDYTSHNMKYIQRDKNTGEEQVFFQDEFSMIVPFEGKIYLWLRGGDRRELVEFDPTTGGDTHYGLENIDFHKLCEDHIKQGHDDYYLDGAHFMTCPFALMGDSIAFQVIDDCYDFSIVLTRDTWEKEYIYKEYAIPEEPGGNSYKGMMASSFQKMYANGYNQNLVFIWSTFGGEGNMYEYGDETRCDFDIGYMGFSVYKSSSHQVLNYCYGMPDNEIRTRVVTNVNGEQKVMDTSEGTLTNDDLITHGDQYFVGYEQGWVVMSKHALYIDPATGEVTKKIVF